MHTTAFHSHHFNKETVVRDFRHQAFAHVANFKLLLLEECCMRVLRAPQMRMAQARANTRLCSERKTADAVKHEEQLQKRRCMHQPRATWSTLSRELRVLCPSGREERAKSSRCKHVCLVCGEKRTMGECGLRAELVGRSVGLKVGKNSYRAVT